MNITNAFVGILLTQVKPGQQWVHMISSKNYRTLIDEATDHGYVIKNMYSSLQKPSILPIDANDLFHRVEGVTINEGGGKRRVNPILTPLEGIVFG